MWEYKRRCNVSVRGSTRLTGRVLSKRQSACRKNRIGCRGTTDDTSVLCLTPTTVLAACVDRSESSSQAAFLV